MILDERNRSVRFAQAGVELDPGGIGKGLAVDKMTAILKYHGIRSALISAGGSTIYALGTPPNKSGWKVTIKDPCRPSKIAEIVELKNKSLSTSGNYEKFTWSKGNIWGHIIDPRTGNPAKVSVIAPQGLDSEAWAKPYYILGRAWIETHKPSHFRVFYCENKPYPRCTWLYS